MKTRTILASIILAAALPATAQKVTFLNTSLAAQTVTPEKSTGLNAIYVLYGTEGVSASFPTGGGQASWYRYSNLGAGFAEEITDVTYDGKNIVLPQVEGDMGYYVEYGDSKRFYFWVTDYKSHRLSLKGVEPAVDQECDYTKLDLAFTGEAIHYFSITGQQLTLDQDIEVSYSNIEWSGDAKMYLQKEVTDKFASPLATLTLRPAVLCQTTFTVTGDRFLKAWNWAESVESSVFNPVAVACETEAEQDNSSTDSEDGSNQIGGNSSGLGGSAPADISFIAYTTDGVIHNEWQFATDEDFNNITYRFTVQDLDYTFTEEGTTYVRFIGSNSDGSCEAVSETYVVEIGSSELKCPNAFSPGATEGVNDVWKVGYRSLVEFQCDIFDRYGKPLFSFSDPSQGWDGKYRGKLVPPGVYFYVIRAKGADGKVYKKSGDINIVGFRERTILDSTPGE